MIIPDAHVRNNDNKAPLCPLAGADTLPTTVAAEPEFAHPQLLVLRMKRLTGWSEARCRATIEANGGQSDV